MDLRDAFALAEDLLEHHGLTDWSIAYDGAKKRAGICRFGPRVIGLSAPLTVLHSVDDVRDTILHEIAHALVGPQHGHDAVWRAKAREIGCSGERCVSADSPRVPGDWVGLRNSTLLIAGMSTPSFRTSETNSHSSGSVGSARRRYTA